MPASATTLEGFRAWAHSDAFPSSGRISFIQGEVLIDMSPEELDNHNKVKTEVTSAVHRLVQDSDRGAVYSDGTLLTNAVAGLSTEPDALFVSWETLESGGVVRIPRLEHPGEHIELQGAPDWVLEVVSRSSRVKDARLLRDAYHRAGVPEYWLIDALGEAIDFQILLRERDGYAAAPRKDGWQSSSVFKPHRFRLERDRDRAGGWSYRLRIE
jgi:Uma2 family endonuclease